MTWNHYQQLRQAAQQRISACVAALQPQGGAGVQIHGRSIALEPFDRLPSKQPPDQWEVVVLGELKITHYGDEAGKNDEPFTMPWSVCWRAHRRPFLNPDPHIFWQSANMFDLRGSPAFPDSMAFRSLELSLQVRTVTGDLASPIRDEDFERLIYRFPVILFLAEYEVVERAGVSGPIFVDYRLIDIHRIPVGREVTTRKFPPKNPDIISFIWPVALWRAG